MNSTKKTVLLVNLGTPKSPSTKDVRVYLTEFLNDPRVIDTSWLLRKFLVNLIIVPFRAPQSAKIYKELWTKDGSPLLIYGEAVQKKLQATLSSDYTVELAMRYQEPSLDKVLERIRLSNPNEIIVLPLFPQYASASTGSVLEKIMRIMKNWYVIPNLRMISQFYDHPKFTDIFAKIGLAHKPENYDHVLFSFHGLPERQVDKVYEDGLCTDRNCHESVTEENKYCYKATCFETAKQIAAKMNLTDYTVCFQSRLGKTPWIEPYSDQEVIKRAKMGDKKLLMFSPAFIADCLETTIEIGDEYQELFEEHGGEKIQLVESLNDRDDWIELLAELVQKN